MVPCGSNLLFWVRGSSLPNISLLAAMQPTDIKEATESTTTRAVGRTKLRPVYAAARLKFEPNPIDVVAPPPTVLAEPKTTVLRGGGGSSLKNQGCFKIGIKRRMGKSRELDQRM